MSRWVERRAYELDVGDNVQWKSESGVPYGMVIARIGNTTTGPHRILISSNRDAESALYKSLEPEQRVKVLLHSARKSKSRGSR